MHRKQSVFRQRSAKTFKSQNLQVIRVDIGTCLIGTSVKVEVSLKNNLDQDLDLDLKPSCNCTDLSITKKRAVKSEAIVIRSQVKLPSSPQKFSSHIQFVDSKRSISFALVVESNVIDAVTIDPSPMFIDQSDRSFSTTISVRSNVPGLKIINVESNSQRLQILKNRELEPSKYAVIFQPDEKGDLVEESFAVRIAYELDGSAEPITRDFFLPVRYTDRVSIGPRISTWKLEGGRYRSKLYLLGVTPEISFDQSKLTITNGKARIPITSKMLNKRAEKAIVFEGSFDEKDLPSVGENETWKIEIESLKYRASSQVVFEVSK